MLNGAKKTIPAEPAPIRLVSKINVAISLNHCVGMICYVIVDSWDKFLLYPFNRWKIEAWRDKVTCLTQRGIGSQDLNPAGKAYSQNHYSILPSQPDSPSSTQRLKQSQINLQLPENMNPDFLFLEHSGQELNIFPLLPWFGITIFLPYLNIMFLGIQTGTWEGTNILLASSMCTALCSLFF